MRSLLLLALVTATAAHAAVKSITVEGNAVVGAEGVEVAVQQAILTAEENAVAELLGSMGGAPESAECLIAEHRATFLESSRPGRSAVDGNIVTVPVTLLIDTDALAKAAHLSPAAAKAGKAGGKQATGRRVMVLASEQLGPREILGWTDFAFSVGPGSASASASTKLVQLVDELGALGATLSAGFSEAGFEVIDARPRRGDHRPRQRPGDRSRARQRHRQAAARRQRQREAVAVRGGEGHQLRPGRPGGDRARPLKALTR